MDRREQLQAILEGILGSSYVYFQPPEGVRMSYPCIRYKLDNIDTTYADNKIYVAQKGYAITIIDPDPDSELVMKLLFALPMCKFNRFYTADNLNHWVYTIYY